MTVQDDLVESGAGAPTLGSGGDSGAFVPGLSPAPIVTFPAPALRTRRADFRHRALQWDHASRTRTARAIRACRWSADAARLPLCIPSPSPARRRACSRLDNIEPVRFDSLTYACDASGIIALIAKGPGIATPAGLLPSVIAPHLRSLSSTGITRRLQSYGPLRHPDRPSLPLTGFRLVRAHHRQGFPCCSHPPLPCVPPPIPRRDRPVRLSLTSRPVAAFPNVRAGRLPHSRFRGLLSVHSRCGPHGRWITLGDPFHRSASNDVVTSIIRSDCYRLERQFAGRDSHPLRDGAFPRHTVRNQERISHECKDQVI